SVGQGRVRHVEPEVVEEELACAPFLLLHAVVPEELEPGELHGHAQLATARAAVSASTCSRTSWTRRIVAPRSYAATAAPTLAAVEPVVAPGSPSNFPSELLRENPMTRGLPIRVSSSRRRISSKLCSTVFPKPIPGSRQIRSSAIPAPTANASRSSRNAATSETTSS